MFVFVWNARRKFPNIFRKFSGDFKRFPKITEHFRKRANDVLIIHSNTSQYFLRDYVAMAMCENNMLFSHVKIQACLRAKAHLAVFHWCIHNKKIMPTMYRQYITFRYFMQDCWRYVRL